MPWAAANAAMSAPVRAVQPPSPTMASGARACASRSLSRAMASAAGAAGSGARCAGASGTSTASDSTSSGSARTTGPGRPEVATEKARATISGRRAASSTCVAHFAIGPYMAR